jgi:serine/threonine-protein kinase
MGRSSLATFLLASVATAATYLFMHFVVGPRLPVPDVEVPPLSGLSAEQARGLLEPRGLLLILDGEKSDQAVAAGTLTAQQPLGGSRLPRGGMVHAFVATAPPTPAVPRVAGLTLADARDLLGKAHLRAGVVAEQPSDTVVKGAVIGSAPPVGAEVRTDSVIDLTVSSGPDAQPVPSVIGKRLSKAKEILEKAGFVAGQTRYGSNDDFDQGVVISQTPAASAPAAKGAKIDLVIND